eukprot:TRINITY_DN9388_c0_g7_i1.p2 TRINITY_DN9388_c0_g7~~TRINITY_DN9388_c0_g7_i1.p2  ORF type:complete len:278 (+),score=78.49 TRINITY_DN9388_c0_g7_i1:609-1442(+)
MSRVEMELGDKDTTTWAPKSVINNLLHFIRRLDNFNDNNVEMEELLKSFFDVELHSESFDSSLVLLMKFLVATSVQSDPSHLSALRLSKKQLLDLLLNSNFAGDIEAIGEHQIWKEIADTIFTSISNILEIAIVYYKCQIENDQITEDKFGQEYKATRIEIMESPRGILSILYPRDAQDNRLTKYDKSVDGKMTTDLKEILQPPCCFKKYYKKAYYKEMMRVNGKVTRRCVVCEGVLSESVYAALKETEEKATPRLVVLLLLVILFLVSVGFVISRA